MDNKEILEKAIQKAIDGGWANGKKLQARIRGFEWYEFGDESGWQEYEDRVTHKDFIFNHDFAKALWGDSWKEDCKTCGFTHYMYDKDQYDDEQADPYIYHLQQMVIAEDPIKYLGENI